MKHLIFSLLLFNLFLSACNLPAPQADSGDDFATAMAGYVSPTPNQTMPTLEATTPDANSLTATPGSKLVPVGKIVYSCQTTVQYNLNQLCIVNADGTGWRKLTDNDKADHYFASVSPEGNSIIFSSNMGGSYEIYELSLNEEATAVKLTASRNNFAPEISPDGEKIIYTHNTGASLEDGQIWISDRDGNNTDTLTAEKGGAWDPVWSPDGTQIMYASNVNGKTQLVIRDMATGSTQQVTNITGLRGRNTWSIYNKLSSYIGTSWNREIAIFDLDGGNLRYVTEGGNNLAPSFSPDGQWIVFTSYRDHYRDNNGCEIYIMRIDGSNVQRLTDNLYCDWQPRWGN